MAEMIGVSTRQEGCAFYARRDFARLMQRADAVRAARVATGEMDARTASDFSRNAALVQAAVASETLASRFLGAIIRANRRGLEALLVDLTTGAAAGDSLVMQSTPGGLDGFRTRYPKRRRTS